MIIYCPFCGQPYNYDGTQVACPHCHHSLGNDGGGTPPVPPETNQPPLTPAPQYTAPTPEPPAMPQQPFGATPPPVPSAIPQQPFGTTPPPIPEPSAVPQQPFGTTPPPIPEQPVVPEQQQQPIQEEPQPDLQEETLLSEAPQPIPEQQQPDMQEETLLSEAPQQPDMPEPPAPSTPEQQQPDMQEETLLSDAPQQPVMPEQPQQPYAPQPPYAQPAYGQQPYAQSIPPVPPKPEKKSGKKGCVIGCLITGLILLLLAIGGGVAFYLISQNSGENTEDFDYEFNEEETDLSDAEPVAEPVYDLNGYEAVDLGLSVRWAEHNVGGYSPSDYGDLIGWGDADGENYSTDLSEYPEYYPDSDISGGQYDMARAQWGGDWRLPTVDECQELIDKCTWTTTSRDGVKGKLVTGPNGNSIFLPYAGFRVGYDYKNIDLSGHYWTSEQPDTQSDDFARNLSIGAGYNTISGYYRYSGQSVRPVIGK